MQHLWYRISLYAAQSPTSNYKVVTKVHQFSSEKLSQQVTLSRFLMSACLQKFQITLKKVKCNCHIYFALTRYLKEIYTHLRPPIPLHACGFFISNSYLFHLKSLPCIIFKKISEITQDVKLKQWLCKKYLNVLVKKEEIFQFNLHVYWFLNNTSCFV